MALTHLAKRHVHLCSRFVGHLTDAQRSNHNILIDSERDISVFCESIWGIDRMAIDINLMYRNITSQIKNKFELQTIN